MALLLMGWMVVCCAACGQKETEKSKPVSSAQSEAADSAVGSEGSAPASSKAPESSAAPSSSEPAAASMQVTAEEGIEASLYQEVEDVVNEALRSIGASSGPTLAHLVEYDTSPLETMTLELELEGHTLVFYMAQIGKWTVETISEGRGENFKCYYVTGETRKMVDIYDFGTGELISAKSKEIDLDEIMSQYQEDTDAVTKQFEDALNSLADEYGLR